MHISFSMPVQVMHGADNDVLWLQRDFKAYLVNLLDTEKCCQVGSGQHFRSLIMTCCTILWKNLLEVDICNAQ